MKAQTSPSSSIIIVLTDGKLEVYPYELSLQEVPRLQSDLQPVSMVQTVVVVLPRLTKCGASEPESTAWGSWTLTTNRWETERSCLLYLSSCVSEGRSAGGID